MSNIVYMLNHVAQSRNDRAAKEGPLKIHNGNIRMSDHDIEFIRENSKNMTARQISDHLDLTPDRVRRVAKMIGVACVSATKRIYRS